MQYLTKIKYKNKSYYNPLYILHHKLIKLNRVDLIEKYNDLWCYPIDFKIDNYICILNEIDYNNFLFSKLLSKWNEIKRRINDNRNFR